MSTFKLLTNLDHFHFLSSETPGFKCLYIPEATDVGLLRISFHASDEVDGCPHKLVLKYICCAKVIKCYKNLSSATDLLLKEGVCLITFSCI